MTRMVTGLSGLGRKAALPDGSARFLIRHPCHAPLSFAVRASSLTPATASLPHSSGVICIRVLPAKAQDA